MGMWPEHDHAAAWSTTDYLLANVCDAIRELTWVTMAINSKHKPKRPEPSWRPGDGATTRPKMNWVDFARGMGGEITSGVKWS